MRRPGMGHREEREEVKWAGKTYKSCTRKSGLGQRQSSLFMMKE